MSTRNNVKGATARERQRCANIVAYHRQRVHLKRTAYKGQDVEDVLYRKCLERAVELLGRIQRELLDVNEQFERPEETPQYHGDFSAEEMERALRVMEEQDQRNNPFEVGT